MRKGCTITFARCICTYCQYIESHWFQPLLLRPHLRPSLLLLGRVTVKLTDIVVSVQSCGSLLRPSSDIALRTYERVDTEYKLPWTLPGFPEHRH